MKFRINVFASIEDVYPEVDDGLHAAGELFFVKTWREASQLASLVVNNGGAIVMDIVDREVAEEK